MAPDGKIVIGLTGQFGAGCTTVADFLNDAHKFQSYSFSAIIEPAARERLGEDAYNKLSLAGRRRILQDQGNKLRESDSSNIAKQIIEQINVSGDKDKDVVVEAFRNRDEVQAFKDAFSNFFLLAVDAPPEERFRRTHSEYGDNLAQFKIDDLRDKGEGEPDHGQQTEECVYLADVSINNREHKERVKEWDKFFYRIEYYMNLMRDPGCNQPSYAELYMRQAYAVSLKSSCTKRRVGAIIVQGSELEEKATKEKTEADEIKEKESYVLATGFNDVPIGEDECRQMGPKDDPRFCPKDYAEEQKLRAMKYCPACGKELSFPFGKLLDFKCPECQVGLARAFFPGKLLDTCRAVHAEESAIIQAARLGSTALRKALLYTTTFPCLLCAKSIINSGIKKIVYNEPYPMDDTVEMLERCEVTLQKYEGVSAWCFDRMFKGPLD